MKQKQVICSTTPSGQKQASSYLAVKISTAMQPCLVIAATPIEISPLLQELRQNTAFQQDNHIDVLITGIGVTATTYHLTRYLSLKRPALIIQAGVGGCFHKNIPLGSVVVIKKEALADQGVIEQKQLKTLFDLKLVGENQFPFQKGWLVNKSEVVKQVQLKKVTGVTVNEITTSPNKVKLYEDHFAPVVESMEGAALHYVALMEQIPFLQLRAVSNYIAERKKQRWNMKESITNLNKELMKLLVTVTSK